MAVVLLAGLGGVYALSGGDSHACEAELEHAGSGPLADLFSGPPEAERGCRERPGGPETFADLARANSARLAREVAPGTQLKSGAFRSAIRQRAELPVIDGAWTPFGTPPLASYRQEYDVDNGSTREGIGDLSGRVSNIARAADGTLYLAASNGGIWRSADGKSWTSVGEGLPTQVVSGIAYTSAGGGRLLALTGDGAFGGSTYAGLGAYYSADGGATWQHAAGVPDGLMGFRLAVDPTDPSKVYAATGGGLFRSADAGASYENVNLPTGADAPDGTPDCSGKPATAKDCFLANVVTDVVVQGAANTQSAGGTPGAVMAAVGWRAGAKANADGAQQAPGNGIYTSPTGAPGTFENRDMAGNAIPKTDPLTQSKLGRIELGEATGPDQDHRIVYAIVQDAEKFNSSPGGLDISDTGVPPLESDYLNGIWVSTDFGGTWRQLEGSTTIDSDITSNSALAPPTCKAPLIGYCPGIQAWYNMAIAPDPTQATEAGVPRRLAFGLEEVWANTDDASQTLGLDGLAEVKFSVVGRYFADEACTLLTATNGLPICPVADGGTTPKFTTHPDQHGQLWVPDASGGGVTLYAGNDGGLYRQHVAAGEQLSNTNWGQDKPEGRSGHNDGLNTLQPYDAAMAKDGTLYMGMQDNGEGKIEPDGSMYTVFGGDGFFTAVDPDDSKIAYEEYVGGAMSVTKDGGKTWSDIQPTNLTGAQFSTPFEMDPNDAKHLVVGGKNVFETTGGADTSGDSWAQVFDLGTQKHPGDGSATPSGDDPQNQLSAVDTRSFPVSGNLPTGPKTADVPFSDGIGTIPGGGDQTDTDTFLPGSFTDHPFKIGPNDGDAAVRVKITWADSLNDWDLYLYRDEGGKLTRLAASEQGFTTEEHLAYPNPPAGDYVVRVVNFAATGTYDGLVTFTQRTDPNDSQPATYVGYCGYCDTITQGTPFANGIATNVGGDKPGKANAGDGWHIAKAAGLPSRYITSVRMDPQDPRTVYVTLAGYGRRWAFPGAVGEDTSRVGTGHVFKSTDTGETFVDVSGDLPDTPANWSLLHNGHLIVGTDIGVFESCDSAGGGYSRLGRGLPATPVSTLQLKPGDPNLLVAATYGRGIYTYRFGEDAFRCPARPGAPTRPAGTSGPRACASTSGFKSVQVTPRGRGLRFTIERRVQQPFTVDVFQQSRGRRVLKPRRVRRFSGRRRSFTWTGSRKLTPGIHFTRVRMTGGGIDDTRRAAFIRTRTRFVRRPQFHAAASCALIASAKLSGPSFGGVTRGALGIAFRLLAKGTVKLTATNGRRTLLRHTIAVGDTKYRRLRIAASRVRSGDVRVTLAAAAGSVTQTVRLTSRRLR